MARLQRENRIDEAFKAASDPELRNRLYKEFGIS